LSIRLTFVAIGIVMLSVIGSYAIRNNMLDVWIVLIFGVVGYFSTRVGLDTGAMALGIILGPMIEENLGKCVSLSKAMDGSVISVFFASNITIGLMVMTGLSFLTPFILSMIKKQRAAQSATEAHRGDGHA